MRKQPFHVVVEQMIKTEIYIKKLINYWFYFVTPLCYIFPRLRNKR
jgi:hypothetical protein